MQGGKVSESRFREGNTYVVLAKTVVVHVRQGLDGVCYRLHFDQGHPWVLSEELEGPDSAMLAKGDSDLFIGDACRQVGNVQHRAGRTDVLKIFTSGQLVPMERRSREVFCQMGSFPFPRHRNSVVL